MNYVLDNKPFEENITCSYNFKYEPDHFQKHGFEAIHNGDNILVTAHTGAGKTALALEAISFWLNQGFQVIYTSPIKTLSNQKFKEFSEDFENVGILTGDVKINPTGDLLIMTAEILRNSILRKNDEEIYEWNFNPSKVKCVILDEVHFINNPNRGMVWEEIITNLSPDIQLVMLSATINGAEKLAKWVGELKNKLCHHIPTPFRPVPLKHYIFWNNEKHLILTGDKGWNAGKWDSIRKEHEKLFKLRKLKSSKYYMQNLIKYLHEKKMTPTNIFLLNRKHVEKSASELNFVLNDHMETSSVNKIWNTHLLDYRDIYQNTQQWILVKKLAEKGIGIHHSGLIPILKEIVEILYSKKLIKVLFATETFAMGVNMPTKTSVFIDVTKFDGNGRRLLLPEEYNQMAGRAGRRGLDKYGEVIILPSFKMIYESEAKKMMTSPPAMVRSKIKLDYNYVLKQLLVKETSESKVNALDFIVDNINNTFFGKEKSNLSKSERLDLVKLNEELDRCDVNIEIYQIFREIKEIDEKIKTSQTSLISLSQSVKKKLQKQHKKLSQKIKSVESKELKKLEKYYEIKNRIESLEKNIEYENTSSKIQIEIICNYLVEKQLLNEDYSFTPLGRIVAEVNECNPLLLGNMIKNNIFDNLEFNELMALLSIFITDNSLESKSIKNLPISDELKNSMYEIGDQLDQFIDDENKLNRDLVYKFTSEWDISTSLFEAIKKWANGEQWNRVAPYYPTFEGNFIKNVIRLTNLARNVYSIAKLTKNVKLMNLMEGFEEKLIRDFVTVDSLYL